VAKGTLGRRLSLEMIAGNLPYHLFETTVLWEFIGLVCAFSPKSVAPLKDDRSARVIGHRKEAFCEGHMQLQLAFIPNLDQMRILTALTQEIEFRCTGDLHLN
jgi:hypothetical protein